MDYFRRVTSLDDYVVHEVAHVFYNCKQVAVGLHETRRREWLLEIALGKREAFAYATEFCSRIVELIDSVVVPRRLLAEIEARPLPPDEKLDCEEFSAVLCRAVAARNDWACMREACAPRS